MRPCAQTWMTKLCSSSNSSYTPSIPTLAFISRNFAVSVLTAARVRSAASRRRGSSLSRTRPPQATSVQWDKRLDASAATLWTCGQSRGIISSCKALKDSWRHVFHEHMTRSELSWSVLFNLAMNSRMFRTLRNQPNSYHELIRCPSSEARALDIRCKSAKSLSCLYSDEFIPQKWALTSSQALPSPAVTSRTFTRALRKANTGVGKIVFSSAIAQAAATCTSSPVLGPQSVLPPQSSTSGFMKFIQW